MGPIAFFRAPRLFPRPLAVVGLAIWSLFDGGASADPPDSDPPAVFDAVFADNRITLDLQAIVQRVELSEEQDFRIVELGRDATTSHQAVAIRHREALHRHDRHDLVVVMLRGHGTLQIGEEERAVGAGSILYIPRGILHAFRNASGEPAIAYAVYTPGFDGVDRVVAD